MKTFNVTFYSDGGHGWAKIQRQVLVNLDIEDQISSYSYQRGDYAYLEEDIDLGLLVNALRKNNTIITFKEKHTDKTSRIRGYDSYQPTEAI